MKHVDLEKRPPMSDKYTWDAFSTNVSRTKLLFTNTENVRVANFRRIDCQVARCWERKWTMCWRGSSGMAGHARPKDTPQMTTIQTFHQSRDQRDLCARIGDLYQGQEEPCRQLSLFVK